MSAYLHERDLGDCVYALASIQALGGGTFYLKPTQGNIFKLLSRLVSLQEYIEGFLPHKGEPIDYDFSTFRKGGIPFGVRLAELHARWIKAKVDFTKSWIKATPSEKTKGKIVVSRTVRYRNRFFPWKRLVEQYYKDMVFVGLESEWRSFCVQNSRYVEFCRCSDLLDVAEAIAGSELFIGNQSSPNAIAEGLKHTMIQETFLSTPDCLFPRSNAIYCFNGNLSCEILGRKFEAMHQPVQARLLKMESPQGGWKVFFNRKEYQHYCFKGLMANIRMELGPETPSNLEEMIMSYTIKGLRLDSLPESEVSQFLRVQAALDVISSSTLNEDAFALKSIKPAHFGDLAVSKLHDQKICESCIGGEFTQELLVK